MQELLRLNGYHPYRPAAWIRVTGEDAHSFLQSQFSNDLNGMEIGRVVYGLWLNHKGKVHGDSFILRVGEKEFRLMSYATPGQVIGDKLGAFIVADDVELVQETDQVAAISFLFDGDAGWSEAYAREGDSGGRMGEMEGDIFIFPGRRHRGEGFDLVGKPASIRGFLDRLGKGKFKDYRLGEDDLEAIRILHGIPAIPKDIGSGELPQEGKLEDGAVSFTKGCYLGQEVMSRLHSMGQVKRHLALVKADRELPYGAPVRSGTKKVGLVKTGIDFRDQYLALALIQRTVGADVVLQVDAGSEKIAAHLSSEEWLVASGEGEEPPAPSGK